MYFVLGIVIGLLAGWWIWGRGASHGAHAHGSHDAHVHDGQTAETAPENELTPTPMIDSEDAIAPTGVPHVVDNRVDVPLDNLSASGEAGPSAAPLEMVDETAATPALDAASEEPLVDAAAQERARAIGIAPAELGVRGDDLKRIRGVGPKLEDMLHDLGVYTFAQMAAWSEAEIDSVDENLTAFKGRVRRDDWRAQAIELRG